MTILPKKSARRGATSRTAPRLEVVARDVVDALAAHPGLGAQLRTGIIEVDADGCRARGHFLITPWHAGVTVFRSSADGLRADLIAELDAIEPEAIANIIARRMAVIVALEADGVDDSVTGTDSDLLPDRVVGTDSTGADVYASDLAEPPCDCHGGPDSGGPCNCRPMTEAELEAAYDAAFGGYLGRDEWADINRQQRRRALDRDIDLTPYDDAEIAALEVDHFDGIDDAIF